jgi:hypothetical protein
MHEVPADREFYLNLARRTYDYARDLAAIGARPADLAYVHRAELWARRMAEGLDVSDIPPATNLDNRWLARRYAKILGPGFRP